MRRPVDLLIRIAALAALAALAASSAEGDAHAAKKKKPKPKPEPTSPEVEAAPPPPAEPPKLRVEFAACPPESFADFDGSGLEEHLRKRCRNLRVPEGAAPTEIGEDDVIVALCVREGAEPGEEVVVEAVEPKTCGLEASVQRASGGATVPLTKEGELARTLRGARIDKELDPSNATHLVLTVQWDDHGQKKTERSPLIFRRAVEPYAGGKLIWFPLPMLTTDFSSSPAGYRLGITPLAVAAGIRFTPSSSSSAWFGTSLFVAWNLLVPNDTQTLSNGTFVRINYKAGGAGLLFDLSGWLGVGIGAGHTFTTDSRTDFRTWLWVGPKVLHVLSDW